MGKQDLSTPLTEDRLEFFLDSRKGARDQCLEILHIILQKENEYNDGWVPFQIIKKHMDKKFIKENSVWKELSEGRRVSLQKKGRGGSKIPKIAPGHLTRLLKDMEDLHIVKKRKETKPNLKSPNKDRIFYQCCGDAITPVFTRLGMAKDYPRLYRENIVLTNNLEFAKCILEQHDLIEGYDAEMERRKAAKEQWKHMSRDEINRKIRNETPEEYQNYKNKLEHDRKYYFKRDLEKMKEEKK